MSKFLLGDLDLGNTAAGQAGSGCSSLAVVPLLPPFLGEAGLSAAGMRAGRLKDPGTRRDCGNLRSRKS